jgi:hypothetical protein
MIDWIDIQRFLKPYLLKLFPLIGGEIHGLRQSLQEQDIWIKGLIKQLKTKKRVSIITMDTKL